MDMSWLAGEAKQIHDIFASLFYSIVALLLAIGVVMSFFRMSIGQVPEFVNLVGRAVLAAFILAALPEIMNTLVDLPERGLPLPTTDGRETRAHYLSMHPDGAEGIPPRPGVLSYAQDRYGDVSLVWEFPGYRIRRQACTASDAYVTWFALDAQNWSFRGFDVADDVYFDLGGEEPHPGMTDSLFKRVYRREDDSHLAYPHARGIDCP